MYYVGMYQPICTFLIVLVSHFTTFDYLNEHILTNHLESFSYCERHHSTDTNIYDVYTTKNMYKYIQISFN